MTERIRGAYLARVDLTEPHLSGVAEKIRAQVAALQEFPADVDILHPAGGAILRNGAVATSYGEGALWKRLVHYFLFHAWVGANLRGLQFLYIRYQGCSPVFLRMLGRLRRANPGLVILLELPSYPYHSESTTLRQKLLSLLDRASRGSLHRHVDRIVTFSGEQRIFGIPTIRTDNGVDVASLTLLPRPPAGDGLRLFGLANLSFWHGYDRVIAGLADYRARGGQRDIQFDIVGTGAELQRLQDQSRQAGLEDVVHFWGPRRGRELDDIVARAHVGISSIGMHRLDVDTSNLKSREFCARGLPFLIGYEDRDFGPGLPFVFRVPADDSAVDVAELAAGYDRLCQSHPDYPRVMRDYAEKGLTWQAKMQPVAMALRGLLAPRREASA